MKNNKHERFGVKKKNDFLEFLLVYGWAILIAVVAIFALVYFGMLSPENLVKNCSTAVDKSECCFGKGLGDTWSEDSGCTDLATCLDEHGAVLYKSNNCGYCNKQIGMFSDYENLNYVECTEDVELCQDAGIQGVPTWYIDGEYHPGLRELSQLAELSGCDYYEEE